MGFQANFTAIDFETANKRSDSACQLAAVVVRDGQVVDRNMWMIRPEPFFFSAINIGIHGIRPEAVEEEPNFGQLWDQIAPYLVDDCIVAHNAPFDIGVLISCLNRHHCDVPALQFTCTRLIASQAWPDRRRYGLKALASWLGVEFRHHDALEDSVACAKVLLAAGIARGAKSLEDLETKLQLKRGAAGDWGVRHAASKRSKKKASRSQSASKRSDPKLPMRRKNRPLPLPGYQQFDPLSGQIVKETSSEPLISKPDWQRLLVRAELIRPLAGKRLLVVGTFQHHPHQEVLDLIARAGGECCSATNADVNQIIIAETNGESPADPSAAGVMPSSDCQTLSAVDLYRLLGLGTP